MDTELKTIVIDSGSGVCKAGFAGFDTPQAEFPSLLGRIRPGLLRCYLPFPSEYVGDKAQKRRGILNLNYPIQKGQVTWDDMEKIWSYSFSELGVDAKDHPVLLSGPFQFQPERERACEIMFEKFNCPAYFFAGPTQQAWFSLWASSGEFNGIVVDCGDSYCNVVPLYRYQRGRVPTGYHRYTRENAITRCEVGGRDLTDHMMFLLNQLGHTFYTPSEHQIAREIKEQLAYVSLDFAEESNSRSQEKSFERSDGYLISRQRAFPLR